MIKILLIIYCVLVLAWTAFLSSLVIKDKLDRRAEMKKQMQKEQDTKNSQKN